ncbi:MAG: transposase [Nitrosopumilales archaeon CG_4_9_14_0_8_um_filter_34_10]|nr:MAG: transposase [Nitrosopumilales archaeon CG_4_9_14_0_8_um_filter_34_10]
MAKKIADFAIRTRTNTSKDVKHFGLKSAIANQILRKYKRRIIKKATNVKLTIPGQGVKFDPNSRTAEIPCLKLTLNCKYIPTFQKIRQVEIGDIFVHISVEIQEPEMRTFEKFIGIDCNTTGHAAVVAIPHTGKIHKLGKSAIHTHSKYKQIRKKLQRNSKFSLLKKIKNKESRIIKNINHHISKKIVEIAVQTKSGIRFENLKGIRKNKKHSRKFRYSLNSWSYYHIQQLTEYKAKKQGIEVAYVAPAYTSQTCSRCGSLGNRDGKKFQCVCGHADHADVNASFNIGKPVSHCLIDPTRIKNRSQLHKESDLCKGSTDTPQTAMSKMMVTVELTKL